MKRLALTIVAALAAVAFGLGPGPAQAHDDTHPEAMQAVLPGQYEFFGEDEVFSAPDEMTAFELLVHPEQATNCIGGIKPSRTAAYAYCYNYSGSGSWQFQIAARAYDGCGKYIWFYGNVGYPYVPGKTTTRKDSYVYTPPGTWRFIAWKIILPA